MPRIPNGATQRKIDALDARIAALDCKLTGCKRTRRALVGAAGSARARADSERDAQIVAEFQAPGKQYGRLKRIAKQHLLSTRQVQRIVKDGAAKRERSASGSAQELAMAMPGDDGIALGSSAHSLAKRKTTIEVPRAAVRYGMSELQAIEKLMRDYGSLRTEAPLDWPEKVLARFSRALAEFKENIFGSKKPGKT